MGGFSMYSVVLMVAATSGGDMASFGNKGGCNGCSGYTASCDGGGFLGLKDKFAGNGCCGGGGFLGLRDKNGCNGGCHGSHAAGCTGTVVEYHAAPAGCHGSASGCHGDSSGCHGSSCDGGGFLGLRDRMGGGGLFKKHKGGCHGCSGGCW